jgi:ATPase involved in DNA repair
MEKNVETSSEQGLLDLSVELSSGDVTAGNEFAIFVLVKNPFSKPLWIREVNVSLPSELKRVHDENIQEKIKETQNNYQKENEERKQEHKELQDKIDGFQQQINELNISLTANPQKDSDEISKLLRKLEFHLESLESQLRNSLVGASNVTITDGAEVDILRIGSQLTNVTIESDNKAPDSKTTKVKQIEIYEPWLIYERQSQERIVKLRSSLPENSALQPGSTAVYTVVLNVKRSLVFTPSKYRLQFYVNYNFDSPSSHHDVIMSAEKTYTNTIAHSLSIRPSVYSVLTGSVIGGIAGAIARLLQSPTMPTAQGITVTLFLSIILGGMAVIFMARKSDAQSFISIEDFWGGILIGFLVGYTGTSFFEGVTGAQLPKP